MITVLDCRSNRSDVTLFHVLRKQWQLPVRVAPYPTALFKRGLSPKGSNINTLIRLAPIASLILVDTKVHIPECPFHLIGLADRDKGSAVLSMTGEKRYLLSAGLQLVGLMRGLTHCDNARCAMWFASEISDIAPPVVCKGCRDIIHG